MNTNRIFLGDLMYDEEFVKTVVLLKCKDDVYVALDDINSIMDVHRINNKKSTLPAFTTTMKVDYYYVDKDSLTPYYKKQSHKTLKKIKFDVLLDSRNPKGINL